VHGVGLCAHMLADNEERCVCVCVCVEEEEGDGRGREVSSTEELWSAV